MDIATRLMQGDLSPSELFGMIEKIGSHVKRPLVKFPKNNTALNEKRIKIIKETYPFQILPV